MKVISKIAIVFTVGVLVAAGVSNVHAFCGVPGTSFNTNYFTPPGTADVLQANAKFWTTGQYNPASPGGTDSGNSLPQSGWLQASGLGFFLSGDWAGDAAFDGCPQDPPNPAIATMNAVITSSDGTDSVFIGICTTENGNGSFDSFLELPNSVPMVQVPKARIVASSRAGNTTNLTVSHEPLAGGIVNNTGCSLAVTGYKVYQQTVPRNAPAPSGPTSRSPIAGGWTQLGAGTTAEGGSAVGQVTCGTDSDVYLLTTLVLDGNVEISQGSRNSTKVECGPTLATPTGEGNDFRFIRKPKSSKGR